MMYKAMVVFWLSMLLAASPLLEAKDIGYGAIRGRDDPPECGPATPEGCNMAPANTPYQRGCSKISECRGGLKGRKVRMFF